MPHLPIRRRGEVVAHALVDLEDDERHGLSAIRWSFDKDGYVVASPARGVHLRLHRVVLGLVKGDGLESDHINGDKLDNRRENLRVATRQQNGQNVAVKLGSASRFRGVYLDRSRRTSKCWRARAGLAGKSHHVGWFATEDEAGAAVRAWYAENMPFAEEVRGVRA